jgi:hypothetical protein
VAQCLAELHEADTPPHWQQSPACIFTSSTSAEVRDYVQVYGVASAIKAGMLNILILAYQECEHSNRMEATAWQQLTGRTIRMVAATAAQWLWPATASKSQQRLRPHANSRILA